MDERKLVETRVRDVLRTKGTLQQNGDVLTAGPTDTVYDCIDAMVDRGIGSIIVMENDEMVGIFTERDYMRDIALKGRSSPETEVREVMTQEVVTAEAGDQLRDCLDRMNTLQCRHLPVVDDEGSLADIISMRDCAQQIAASAESGATQLVNYVTGQYSTR
ncbi:CBS domain-containing protein [Salinibacter altiplanensis]|uniref:CBS domain-containing protein n=1 Tax=Salinibacter altiplanensis TaxID=1803181 RepID=UPI000C9F46CC|nr:CBS domain-containing protein [Salinibacter altiplanensis]